MKRLFIGLLIFLIFLPVSIVKAENDDAAIQITGSTSTMVDNLAIIHVSASSCNPLYRIEGTVNYDSSIFTIFDVTISENKDWNITLNKNSLGKISFTAIFTGEVNNSTEDVQLFTVQFIVFSAASSSTSFTCTDSSGIAEKITVLYKKGDITNQEEIDAASTLAKTDKSIKIPEAIFASEDVVKKESAKISFLCDGHQIVINNPKSSNTYLKSLNVDHGELSPAFSKLTTAYKLTILEGEEFNINYIVENPNTTVSISQEVNNQIIITLTAEDSSSAAYVITVIRQKDYNSKNPTKDEHNQDPYKQDSVIIETGVTKDMEIALIGLGSVGIIGIIIGAILVYKGSHY